MFGLSWTQIGIIVVVGAFVLGPERIPTAVRFVGDGLTRARGMVAGAQDGLRREIGPELDELRRQVAELQGLRDLIDLRDYHPQRLLGGVVGTFPAEAHAPEPPTPGVRAGDRTEPAPGTPIS